MILNSSTILAGFNDVLLTGDTKMLEIFQKTRIFLEKYPEIRASIECDLSNYSVKQKKMRLADKSFEEEVIIENNEVLFDSRTYIDATRELELKAGRPGMPTDLIFFFMQVRGMWGSVTDQDASERLKDSKSIEAVLDFYNHKMPGFNTIRENLNKISEGTRGVILTCQSKYILEEKIDNYAEIFADSTHVKANTSFPTDIDILYKLLDRLYVLLNSLPKFSVPVMIGSWTVTRLEKMLKHLKYVNMNCGKGLKGKTKEEYKAFLKLSVKVIDDLKGVRDNATPYWEKMNLTPSLGLALDSLWDKIEQDICDAEYVFYYADLRINNNTKTPSVEKILSISDRDAGYIKKGQREAVIGYKPQIARSKEGFICGYITPRGNAADSNMLMPLIKNVIETTGVTPSMVSVDDGYSSEENFSNLHNVLKIETVSLGGSKGKTILKDLWDKEEYVYARRQRSAVESGMFTLKFNHNFGLLRRRGLEAVDAELTEKIIAYNFIQIIRVEKRKKAEEEKKQIEVAKVAFAELRKSA